MQPCLAPAALIACLALSGSAHATGFVAGDTFDDCSGAGWCPPLVVVPAGAFVMGSPPDEPGRWKDEEPRRRIEISAFAAGKFEVTFAQWSACADDGGCGRNPAPADEGWGRGNRPVIHVSWEDTRDYVAWLSKKTGAPYRLLAEAEWEYAARAGSTARWSWGDEPDDACDHANFWDPTGAAVSIARCPDGIVRQTAEAGRYRANAFGLHDMHGNVWEWVEDCYAPNYPAVPAKAGNDDAAVCKTRVKRGGGWFSLLSRARAAERESALPRERSRYVGFRIARDID